MKNSREVAIALLSALLVVGYAVFSFSQNNLPFTDLPNHAARATIIADLLYNNGLMYGDQFIFEAGFVPYIFGDLLLATLVELFSPDLATRIYVALYCVAPAIAMGYYARSLELQRVTCALIVSVGLFLGTDQAFTQAFANYRLSIAVLFIALAALERFRRTGALGWALCFFIATVLAHLTHFAATLILCVAISITACVAPAATTRNRSTLFAALLVPTGLLAFQILTGRDHPGSFQWNSPLEKAYAAFYIFHRYAMPLPWDRLLTVGLYFTFALGAVHIRTRMNAGATRTGLFIAGALIMAFFALPTSKGTVSIDLRLVPPALAFVAVAVFGAFDEDRQLHSPRGLALAFGALLLPALNLAYLFDVVGSENKVFGEVRAALRSLPHGARVLPLQMRYEFGRDYIHTAAFSIIDRAGFTPHLFSGDQGHPQVYFRYRDRPEAPGPYAAEQPATPAEIESIQKNWPYILVVGPREDWRAPLPATTLADAKNSLVLRVHPGKVKE